MSLNAIDDSFGIVGEVKYYRVDNTGNPLTLWAATSGNTNTAAALYHKDGTLIISDQDSGPGMNFKLTRYLNPPNFFYIVMWESGDDATGSYKLKLIEGFDLAPFAFGINSTDGHGRNSTLTLAPGRPVTLAGRVHNNSVHG